ncbi:DNA glycosylase [Stachybotrys elegans]|uniref:DNA-(apurinic or apyrimidinic site) lyase n=1 Tax=Stachybotrys elegans TaxID=80388 RepID=A0A8K0T294_9HYPO|nr:DNA glycosylase [Stachybotrys elegans]
MAIKRLGDWRKLPVSLTELCIDTTLRCGQSFRWRKINDEWTCALRGRLLSLKQDSTHLHYKVTWPEVPPAPEADDTEELLHHYFSLSLDLGSLYEQWSQVDPNFRKRAPTFSGVRILSQDAWEALVSFICSSNNNISRISQMVHKLCRHYGPLIAYVGDEAIHDLPGPGDLVGPEVEAHLRELGFGYRAKYIAQTARIVAKEKPNSWLESLRNPQSPSFASEKLPESQHKTYREAHDELLALAGVGPKVADCVCLMGLGWGESVPVDTHVWQIAQRDYKMGKTKSKTFNKAMYDAVGDHFRELWGPYAGWAHSVLFTADLREFAEAGIKKEGSVKEVKVKEEIIEEVTGPRRKRKTVETTIESQVKLEDAKVETDLEIRRTSKRRQTRASSRTNKGG